jgi:hypothetical protein
VSFVLLEAGSFELSSSLPQATIVPEKVRHSATVPSIRFIDTSLFRDPRRS